MKYTVIAAGKIKGSDFEPIFNTYLKRIKRPLILHEVNIKGEKTPEKLNQLENEKIRSLLPVNSPFIIALDPKGKMFSSTAFVEKLEAIENDFTTHIVFLIGGADGLDEKTKESAHILLSFGDATWPHLLARVMLIEQLYRVQQIRAGHPYHKE